LTADVDRIWIGDLLGRQPEANSLQDYIESISMSQMKREGAGSFTLAIDAPYGVGKTFFLKRLSQQLAFNHPVAYIDAWTDDIINEPLTAIAATLKNALSPLLTRGDVSLNFSKVLKVASDVAKISAVGLAKKGLGLLITSAAAEEVHELFKHASDEMKDVLKDQTKDVGKSSIEGGQKILDRISSKGVMEDRISDFESGRKAISELKSSLSNLVNTLEGEAVKPPIIIIIDELDRCRPSYAVKLLEEVKHLFDVPGVVFILGVNLDQLSKSLSVEYGHSFDGNAYLRRFVSKRYALNSPKLDPLIEYYLDLNSIEYDRIYIPQMINSSETPYDFPLPSLIRLYFQAYLLTAREVERFTTDLQTFLALNPGKRMFAPCLFPLICRKLSKIDGKFQFEDGGMFSDIDRDIGFSGGFNHSSNSFNNVPLLKAFQECLNYKESDINNLVSNRHSGSHNLLINYVFGNGGGVKKDILLPGNYEAALKTVGKFT
jgi:hypothetical protein